LVRVVLPLVSSLFLVVVVVVVVIVVIVVDVPPTIPCRSPPTRRIHGPRPRRLSTRVYTRSELARYGLKYALVRRLDARARAKVRVIV
jgi:hypothetical protein